MLTTILIFHIVNCGDQNSLLCFIIVRFIKKAASSVLKLKTENITPSLRGTRLCKYGKIYVCLLKETGTFWRSANIPITAHSLLQYVHISDSKSSGRHPPPCITTEEVFIASCHATHSRQRAILKPARVMLHNRAKPPPAQICAAWTLGFFSLLFQSAFTQRHGAGPELSFLSVSECFTKYIWLQFSE